MDEALARVRRGVRVRVLTSASNEMQTAIATPYPNKNKRIEFSTLPLGVAREGGSAVVTGWF